MPQLPAQYQWLQNEPVPKMILEALNLFGIVEQAGTANNPTIIKWAEEVGGNVDDVYKADDIPWCGLFMAVVSQRAGQALVKDPLWALNWGTFGTLTDNPMLGDVLVYTRKKGGHVGLYVGEDQTAYHTLGGNQSDCVCITRMPKERLYTARRPTYTAQPVNVRKIRLKATGNLSVSEQ